MMFPLVIMVPMSSFPHKLTYLNTCSPVGYLIWGNYGILWDGGLMEAVCCWMNGGLLRPATRLALTNENNRSEKNHSHISVSVGLEFEGWKSCHLVLSVLPACWWNMIRRIFDPVIILAYCLAFPMMMDFSLLKVWTKMNPFLLMLLLVFVFYHSNRKVANIFI